MSNGNGHNSNNGWDNGNGYGWNNGNGCWNGKGHSFGACSEMPPPPPPNIDNGFINQDNQVPIPNLLIISLILSGILIYFLFKFKCSIFRINI